MRDHRTLQFVMPKDPDIADILAFWSRRAEQPSSFLARLARDTGVSIRPPEEAPASPLEALKQSTETLQPLSIQAGLEAYTAPLDRRHAAHLLRRIGFGANAEAVNDLVGQTAEDAVDALVEAALSQPLPDPPAWIDEGYPLPPDPYVEEDYRKTVEAYTTMNQGWLVELVSGLMRRFFNGSLRERLTLFWHSHFVTEIDAYFYLAVYGYRYIDALRTHALGNFKDFVHAIGLDSTMLVYLNGFQNEASAPNENYARELLELFTMGQFDGQGTKNYTQADIEEIARALTGWFINPYTLTVEHLPFRHDAGEKTIFGRTGTWGYDDVIDILFEERGAQIAEFIARKLYREFIYAAEDEALVADLAQVLLDNNFETAPVLRALFKSAHFFDEQAIGAQIKSPLVMLPGLLREAHVEDPSDEVLLFLFFRATEMQQFLLDPPNVAGWPGHHAWINTTTLPTRWFSASELISRGRDGAPLDLTPVSITLLNALDDPPDPNDPTSVFTLACVLAEHLIPAPLDLLDLNASDDPVEGFAGDLDSFPIPPEVLGGPDYALKLAKIFLQGIFPWYEWRLDHLLAPAIVMSYARTLAQLPEYQLT